MRVLDSGRVIVSRTECLEHLLFFFSSRRRHTRSVSAFLLNRSSDLHVFCKLFNWRRLRTRRPKLGSTLPVGSVDPNFGRRVRSEERFSRNAETDLVCRLLLEKKKQDSERNTVSSKDGQRKRRSELAGTA